MVLRSNRFIAEHTCIPIAAAQHGVLAYVAGG
jgi:hypothetical protein